MASHSGIENTRLQWPNEEGAIPMEEKILTALKTIVGEEYVSEGTAGTRRFLRPGWETPSLVSVRAERDEEVQ